MGHAVAGPVILAGVAGTRVSVVLLVEVPPQELEAVTESVPEVNALVMLSVIEVPLLVTILQPAGTDQL